MPVLLPQLVRAQQRDIQNTKLPRITTSALRDILCSKRYDATRVSKTAWQEKQPQSINTPRGSAYHDALQALHHQRRGCELPVKDLSLFACDAVYRARYERGVDLQAEQKIVEAIVQLFLDNQDPEDVEAIFGLEEQAEFNLIHRGEPLACMSATIDRLLVRPNNPTHLVLQDFKMGNRRIDMMEAFLLLWCAKRKWCEDSSNSLSSLSLEYIWLDLDDHQVYVDVITTQMVRGHQKYLVNAIEHVIRHEPTAEPGPSCVWCPIRRVCQSGLVVRLEDGEMVF